MYVSVACIGYLSFPKVTQHLKIFFTVVLAGICRRLFTGFACGKPLAVPPGYVNTP
jgi:hypothetical protein